MRRKLLIKKGLGVKLQKLLGIKNRNEYFVNNLEDLFIESDLGAATTMELISEFETDLKTRKTENDFLNCVKDNLKKNILSHKLVPQTNTLNFFLVLECLTTDNKYSICLLADSTS